MINGNVPIYGQFGQNVFASDVVQQAIACIAQEISKLTPKHIRFDKNNLQVPIFDSISDLLEYGPNEWSTTKDFLEKITWQLFLNYNVFILPVYDEMMTGDGKSRKYRALYPLEPTEVSFIVDGKNELYVDFRFNSNEKLVVKYSDLIHWRYRYSVNPFMGGNANGQPDTQALLQTVDINHKLLQSIEKSVNSSMQIYGVMKYNTILDEDNMKAEISRFEKMLAENKNGIIGADLKSEYIQIKPDPKLVDPQTLAFIDSKILRHYGVSIPILSGDFTPEQYQSFYEKTLEPLINSLNQVFTKSLFTQRELQFGNKIVFYANNLLYMALDKRVAVGDLLGNRGALTNNDLLALFGYPPYEEGNVRLMSLNYVDVNIAHQYQLKNASTKPEESPNEPKE
ncbi:MAG TPA: portal protein [Erysipelotrichaceae bacterium]|nr:portal protein [Erysipelotrichaceae bacterium]